MRTYNKFLSLIAISSLTILTGCQKDEALDLTSYPDNSLSLVTEGKDGSEIMVNATYNKDGLLELDKPATRTFTFRFDASPEDVTVTFEPILANITADNIELSNTKVIVPAGYTDVSVTIGLKDKKIIQSNYDKVTYKLGVKASVQGYKMVNNTQEATIIIKKEAYVASCFLQGKEGSKTTFDHIYNNGQFINPEPNSYTFSIELDRPAHKDVKVKLTTTGLDDKYMKDITINPAEIVIPAGQVSSGDITWKITNDFLLRTEQDIAEVLTITANVECEDPVVIVDEEKNSFTLNISKTNTSFEYVSNKKPTGWTEWDKTGWSVEVPDNENIWQNDGGNVLINGKTNDNREIGCTGDLLFIVDMKEEKAINGVGLAYVYSNCDPKKVHLSGSSDGKTWNTLGKVETKNSTSHYFRFFEPVTTRYIKFELLEPYKGDIELFEIYIFK